MTFVSQSQHFQHVEEQHYLEPSHEIYQSRNSLLNAEQSSVNRRSRKSRQSSTSELGHASEDTIKQQELVQQQIEIQESILEKVKIESQESILENVTQQMVIEVAQDSLKEEARKERMQLKKHLEREKKRLEGPSQEMSSTQAEILHIKNLRKLEEEKLRLIQVS